MEQPPNGQSWKDVAAALKVEMGVVKQMVYDRDGVLSRLQLKLKEREGQLAEQFLYLDKLERKVALLQKKAAKAAETKGKKKKK